MTTTAKQVHVTDRDGSPLYNRLLDDGTNVLRFEVYGFVTRDEARRSGWQIRDGWHEAGELPAQQEA